MTKTVTFYFDYGSPATYLAWTQIKTIIEEANATLNMVPILLGGVFKETGNTSPATVPAKGKWMNNDLKKHSKIYNVEFNSNSFFPINTLLLEDLFRRLLLIATFPSKTTSDKGPAKSKFDVRFLCLSLPYPSLIASIQ